MRSAYLKDMFGIRYVGAIHGLLNGLVRRGRFRSGVGQLHPRVPNQSRRAEDTGIQCDHVHNGGTARHRLHLQLHDKGRLRASLYEAGSVGRSGSGVRR